MKFYIISLKWTFAERNRPDFPVVFWRPEAAGYTTNITEAGQYTLEEVGQIKKTQAPHEVQFMSVIIPEDFKPFVYPKSSEQLIPQ